MYSFILFSEMLCMKKKTDRVNGALSTGRMAYGVLVLSVSGILVKVIGLLFKIPLTNMIGEGGMGYFNSAYTIYSFFYMISTAGLPIALSILISSSRGEKKRSKVFSVALALFTALGGALSCFMFLGAGLLCDFISNPGAVYAVMTMAPCLFFVCILSAYRGYFQGYQSMLPTAVSQLIEAAGKLIFGMVFALWALNSGCSTPVVASFAVLGITASSGLSMLYLVVAKRFFKAGTPDGEFLDDPDVKTAPLLKKLIKLALPISLSSAVLSLSGLLDLAVVMRRLGHIGFSPELANAIYGNYTSLAIPLFNMPTVLITPISCALVPFIARALSSNDKNRATNGAKSCLKYATIIALPASVGMSLLAEPILKLIFDDTLAKSAAPLLSVLAISIIFVAYTNVTVSVMQSCGKIMLPILSMAIGGLVKLVCAWVLIGKMGMVGAPVSTVLCYVTMTLINFTFLDKMLDIRVNLAKMTFVPLVSTLLMALVASFSQTCLETRFNELSCLVSVCVAGIVYLSVLLLTGYIRKEELQRLPVIKKFIKKTQKDNMKG